MITAPCKNCIDRFLGCHDKCPNYKEYRNEIITTQQIIKKNKRKYNEIDGYEISKCYRLGR